MLSLNYDRGSGQNIYQSGMKPIVMERHRVGYIEGIVSIIVNTILFGITSIFIGVLLVVIAWTFIKDSFENFKARESADFGLLAIIVTIVSILTKEGLAQYAFYLSRKTNNLSVKADGWHHRTDALSSVIVLIGIMLRNYLWWIDSALGIIISLMLVYAAYRIIAESIDKLLGEKPSNELVTKIKNIVDSISDRNLHPHHFHMHNYVNHKELTFHLIMDGKLSIHESHDIVTRIENEIREKLDIESTIHVEPVNHG
jgi:cation diffusion facilitator family transporter